MFDRRNKPRSRSPKMCVPGLGKTVFDTVVPRNVRRRKRPATGSLRRSTTSGARGSEAHQPRASSSRRLPRRRGWHERAKAARRASAEVFRPCSGRCRACRGSRSAGRRRVREVEIARISRNAAQPRSSSTRRRSTSLPSRLRSAACSSRSRCARATTALKLSPASGAGGRRSVRSSTPFRDRARN